MVNAVQALVLFSGGQDSTTCLAWALDHFEAVQTVGFNYGQRHSIEMKCRSEIRERIGAVKELWRERLAGDHVLDASILSSLSDTALTGTKDIAVTAAGLPTTFVPGRNIFFLTLAAVLAYRHEIKHLVTGVCETDYSGYPDCRDDTIKATQLALNGAMARQFVIHTPLMWLDKAATFDLADKLGGGELVQLIIEHTHTCYQGDRRHRHEWGYGCEQCPACELRAQGYQEWRQRSGSDFGTVSLAR